jgi:hypothetical protein
MRTTTAVISSTYSGTAINADASKGIFIEHRSQSMETRGGVSVRLGVSGRMTRPHRNMVRTVLYVGMIQADPAAGDQEASLRAAITAFETLMSAESHGDLVEEMEDGTTRTLDVRPRNYEIDRWEIPEYANCSVEFESWDSAEWAVTPAGS